MGTLDCKRLLERSLQAIAQGHGDRGGPASSPVSRYLDPQRHRIERERVLWPMPTVVAAATALAEPGAFVTHDASGRPLLVVRAPDGRLRGYLNACRHRGTRLVGEAAGTARRFVCPYHAWTYGLDGALLGRPHAEQFPHAPAQDCRLVEVPVAQRCGLVWAVATPASSFDWDGYFGGFGDELESLGFDDRSVVWREREFAHPSNWKLTIDAGLETYHVQYAHRKTIAGLFHDDMLVADSQGPNRRLVLPKRSIATLAGAGDVDAALFGRHANIIYFFFPNTLILWQGDHANLSSVFAAAPDRSVVQARLLVPARFWSLRSDEHWRKNDELFWSALDEDFAMMASIQSTLASGANAALRFGASEFVAAGFHQDVERLLGAEADAGSCA
ncbi:MAG TPA: aromatic ring-hydroxylating dioxygenase subunit alpha [Burkholderiaceae bacterium]|nr:aromatic ring-hydroxylating dioxygenase subunit alpha [Burkholderiaceae bacterium]